MFPSLAHQKPSKNFFWAIAIICLSYLIFQIIYIPYAALSVDEFWFAHHIYEYTTKIPYSDFLPYKTVLGYYLLSIPMYFYHTLLQPIFYIKDEIAIINTMLLAGASIWLSRSYNSKAIIYTILFIITHHLFLVYSVDLRVDMLTSWFGLISVLLLLSNRSILAGIFLAISFMISQKALWFFIATDIALGSYWLLYSRKARGILQSILFNLAVCLPIMFYVFFWSIQSDLTTVLNSVFHEGYTQSQITFYSDIYYYCWHAILSNGPMLVLLWPLTWIMLFVHSTEENQINPRRFFIAIYSTVMMLFILTYQQAFPYGMVFTIPVYFLIYPDFFSWCYHLFQKKPTLSLTLQRHLFWLVSLYTAGIIGVMIIMALPLGYFLIALIPVCIGTYLILPTFEVSRTDILKLIILVIFICTGLLYPMIRFIRTSFLINGNYQQSMVLVSNELLKEGGGYFAGTPLIYDQEQTIRGMKNLIGPQIEYLSSHSNQLLPVLISSLNLEPRTSEQVISDLTNSSVKLYVNNYRIKSLPEQIHRYLNTEFMHYWGSIYIYAPSIQAKKQTVVIKFSGNYQVITKPNSKIYFDNIRINPNAILFIKKGIHHSNSESHYRLRYLPKINIYMDPTYQKDYWYRMIKPVVT